ncbi:Uncharacterised protein [Mycobacteroides abscessus subsp. abscessus]|nr:Uncharacterised protein [Mycobacteroides abscessus subsp. abscessus]SHW88044.1 Uncharacterised protein [Mycobacteroides abscessus subsp. abscessus]
MLAKRVHDVRAHPLRAQVREPVLVLLGVVITFGVARQYMRHCILRHVMNLSRS